MAIVTVRSAEGTYVLIEDRAKPEAEQTRFRLRTWSAKTKAFVEESLCRMSADGSSVVTQATGSLVALKYGIIGWENLKDSNGNALSPRMVSGHFGFKVLADECVNWLDDFKYELFQALASHNGIEGEDDKPDTDLGKSQSSPNSPSAKSSDEPNTAE